MDYCKKCKNFGCNAAGTERTTTDCEDYMSHLPTNADRIRAMTDEELAEFFQNTTLCDSCFIFKNECGTESYSCIQRWLDWLRQEVTNG